MTKSKTYGIKITSEVQTDPIREASKSLRDLHLILSMIILPWRLYHTAMRLAHMLNLGFGSSASSAVAPINAESVSIAGQTAVVEALNLALRQLIILQAMATGGASLTAAGAGLTAATALTGIAMGAGTIAQTHMGTMGTVVGSGAAIVHAGEKIGRGGGGFGGTVSITNNITMDPAGLDFNDFTDKVNESMRLALRGHVRDIPV